MKPLEWVKLPTQWIAAGGLRKITWRVDRSAGTASLMVLIALAHHADASTGQVRVTYDALEEATGLSRTLISRGLRLLEAINVIARIDGQRGAHRLVSFTEAGWGKLPAKRMYAGSEIALFRDFHLRSLTELNALKLFLWWWRAATTRRTSPT